MTRVLSYCLAASAIVGLCHGVTTKVDFDEDSAPVVVGEDDDVEVKHTIVVSTKLKNNNNRKGIHSADNFEPLIGINKKSNTADSGEVPIVKPYKSIDSTAIRTPDSRLKTKSVSNPVFIYRNTRDEYDSFPNTGMNAMSWRPSAFYNNINWRDHNDLNNRPRGYNRPENRSFNRAIGDDGVREFYCRKCRELNNNFRGCVQQKSNPRFFEITTPKMKIDGKLAKLN